MAPQQVLELRLKTRFLFKPELMLLATLLWLINVQAKWSRQCIPAPSTWEVDHNLEDHYTVSSRGPERGREGRTRRRKGSGKEHWSNYYLTSICMLNDHSSILIHLTFIIKESKPKPSEAEEASHLLISLKKCLLFLYFFLDLFQFFSSDGIRCFSKLQPPLFSACFFKAT